MTEKLKTAKENEKKMVGELAVIKKTLEDADEERSTLLKKLDSRLDEIKEMEKAME